MPALSLPFDMRETMAAYRAITDEYCMTVLTRNQKAVIAYLVTHFSEKATFMAARVLDLEVNIETVCEELKRFKAEGGKPGVSRFRNQSLETRTGVLRQLSVMEWKQFKSLKLWTEQVAREVKGIDSFGAMRVAIVLLHDGYFNLMSIAGEAPLHADEALPIKYGAKNFLYYYRVPPKEMEAVARELQVAVPEAVATELKAPKYNAEQQRKLRKKNREVAKEINASKYTDAEKEALREKNTPEEEVTADKHTEDEKEALRRKTTPEEEVTAPKYTVVEQQALTKLLRRWMSFLEVEQVCCETSPPSVRFDGKVENFEAVTVRDKNRERNSFFTLPCHQ